MHVLVLWLESKTTSIVNKKDLNPSKHEGESTFAIYKDGKSYEAKIIRKHGKYLYINDMVNF